MVFNVAIGKSDSILIPDLYYQFFSLSLELIDSSLLPPSLWLRCGSVFIYCAELDIHVLQFWEMVLTYFLDDFFLIFPLSVTPIICMLGFLE